MLKSLFAVAEAYPQLQASQNFLQLALDCRHRRQDSGLAPVLQRWRSRLTPRSRSSEQPVCPQPGFNEREFFEVTDGAAISEPPRVQF